MDKINIDFGEMISKVTGYFAGLTQDMKFAWMAIFIGVALIIVSFIM